MTTDGTDKRKDTSQAEDSSSENQETSNEPETFTAEDVKAREQKAASDALSKAGRTAADLDKQATDIKAREDRMEEEHRRQVEAARYAARDDNEALSEIDKQERERERVKKLDEREHKLNEKASKLEGVEEKATKTEIRERAEKVAAKENVSAEKLIKFTDGSLEAMEELAQSLPPASEEGKAKRFTKAPDSGKNIGGGQTFTRQSIANMSPEEYAENKPAILKAQEEGRVK